MTTTCNKCGKDFSLLFENIFVMQGNEYDISYLECPHCKEKYLICTFDEKMHELIIRRKQLEQIIHISRSKKFRSGTVKRYIAEYENVKAEQKRLANELKPIGEKILKKVGEGEGDDGSRT